MKNNIENFILISVIICTYNRAKYLERCIESLKKQTYPNLEIIVVNGPSTDDTECILQKYSGLKIIRQKKLNGLSFARNLGIDASNGDIVAFIDDDAIADKDWIKCLINGYVDKSVGGVGGLVISPKDSKVLPIQFDRGTINKCGVPTAIRDEYGLRNGEFSIIMGTNSSFRKDILYEVGGFDPYFKYYHDESDLCVRIALKGYNIVYQRDALVIHDMAEGHNRRSPHDSNWSEIMKNVIYFTLKNFRGDFSSYIFRPIKSFYWLAENFYHAYRDGAISMRQLFDIYLKLIIGAVKGYIDGMKINLVMTNRKHDNALIYQNKKKMIGVHMVVNDKMLKICLLSQEFSKNCNGGICRYTYDLAHSLAEFGNEIHVITRSEKNCEYEHKDGKIFIHKITPEPINFLNLQENMEISRKNLEYSYAACLKLLNLIDKFGVQIVEVPLWDAEGFVFSLVKNIPLVVRIETPLFKVAEIQEWKITKDLKLANWIEGETVRRADKVIAISKNIGVLIGNHHNVSGEMIELCPLGIELPDEKLINNQNEHRLNVLFVGRLEKRKGIETLFRAIPMILSKVPDIQFNIVGKDTNLSPDGGSYKKYLLKNIDKKFHDSIKFAGYVKNEELKNYYQNCDIFVAPSLYESFGLIFLEAMAWGKPVIGCDIGGISEIIDNNKNGILIKPNDHGALAEEIIKLLTNIELRNKMGSDGRCKVKDNFSIKKMAEDTSRVYKDINNHMI